MKSCIHLNTRTHIRSLATINECCVCGPFDDELYIYIYVCVCMFDVHFPFQQYRDRTEFMADIRLICFNCLLYNGEESSLYANACEMRLYIWGELRRRVRALSEVEEGSAELQLPRDALLQFGTPGEEVIFDLQRLHTIVSENQRPVLEAHIAELQRIEEQRKIEEMEQQRRQMEEIERSDSDEEGYVREVDDDSEDGGDEDEEAMDETDDEDMQEAKVEGITRSDGTMSGGGGTESFLPDLSDVMQHDSEELGDIF